MYELLVKIALFSAVTHGVRALCQIAGPRRGGLLLGLPSTTAVALISCGLDRGVDAAMVMAEASIFGLVAAVALPLSFARALGAGLGAVTTAAIAVSAYLTVASGSHLVPDLGAGASLLMATMAVLLGCRASERIAVAEDEGARIRPSRRRRLILRFAIPTVCLTLVTALRESAGPHWAGLFSTFPGLTLTMLVVSLLESGAPDAARMAKALPKANLGMIAFVGTFRFLCPMIGLGWGTACGYASASVILLGVAWATRGGAAESRPTIVTGPAGRPWIRLPRVPSSLSFPLGTRADAAGRRRRPIRRRPPLLVEPIGL